MTTATKQAKVDGPSTTFDFPSVDETTQRMRDLNERLVESSKSAGLVALDAFEQALKSVEDFEHQVAAATHIDWVSAAATAHTKFISEMTGSYTAAARDLLK